MTDKELLEKVKRGLGVGGTYQDETLQLYIDEVKDFMKNAGVTQTIIDGSKSVGVIIRGVADLWNYGAGSATLSPYFMQRVTQLAYDVIDGEEASE